MFHPSSFYWDAASFGCGNPELLRRDFFGYRESKRIDGEKKIKAACEILNQLTKEQLEAVELYGTSQYLEGEASARTENQ